ncbi:MAG: hypothetical protein RLP02_35415 [Coleofasciculus sp. C2-GNP5-27]
MPLTIPGNAVHSHINSGCTGAIAASGDAGVGFGTSSAFGLTLI